MISRETLQEIATEHFKLMAIHPPEGEQKDCACQWCVLYRKDDAEKMNAIRNMQANGMNDKEIERAVATTPIGGWSQYADMKPRRCEECERLEKRLAEANEKLDTFRRAFPFRIVPNPEYDRATEMGFVFHPGVLVNEAEQGDSFVREVVRGGAKCPKCHAPLFKCRCLPCQLCGDKEHSAANCRNK